MIILPVPHHEAEVGMLSLRHRKSAIFLCNMICIVKQGQKELSFVFVKEELLMRKLPGDCPTSMSVPWKTRNMQGMSQRGALRN